MFIYLFGEFLMLLYLLSECKAVIDSAGEHQEISTSLVSTMVGKSSSLADVLLQWQTNV